jgi:hypothetical protein
MVSSRHQEVAMYQTLKATVRRGRIELVDDVTLPEKAALLVTIMEEVSPEALTLGEHLTRGLADVGRRRATKVGTNLQLERHLDSVFGNNA